MQRELLKAFSDLDDKELVVILKGLTGDQLEQIAIVLEDMADNKPVAEAFIRR
jgi:hypothetical protein